MSNIKDGGNAFPVPDPFLLAPKTEGDMQRIASGMSVRDIFAANALAGFCANPAVFAANSQFGWGLVNCTEEQLTEVCGRLADAMLAEREKRETAPIQAPVEEKASEVRPHRYCRPDCAHEDRDYASEADKKAGWPYTCRKCGFELPF